MGAIYNFEKEKLIIGVIYHEKETLDTAMEILVSEFGPVHSHRTRGKGISLFRPGKLRGGCAAAESK